MVRYLGSLTGLNPDIQDKKHRSALHIAAEKGNTRMMDFLVDKCKASLSHRTKVLNFMSLLISFRTIFKPIFKTT